MPGITVVYADSGRIVRWRPTDAPNLNPDHGHLAVDIDDPSDLDRMRVDVDADDPQLVEVNQAPENVDRSQISEATKQRYRDASSASDKCDVLFEILTGEQP